ncbi:thioredoxin domain-containing protein [Motiliproteus sp. MSK22-1]|uniref:DsbA family protein n=1 Tax=Motiliproteus sp. MSK22-1 TaxID=1897630 RepID=UPI000978A0CC|nr:thioredoxin domain-containing protein [Motiliproteus sp. MSK22-1]OMH25904.1 hypothetical protein BGP75_25680 [Motiliproteus sp. MSK22-1]
MGTTPDKQEKKSSTPFSPLNIIVAVALIAGALFYIQPTAPLPTDEDQSAILFSLSGKDYRAKDLPFKYSQPLYQIELESYRRRLQIISTAAVQAYVEQQVIDTGESREIILKRLFPSQAPTLAQINSFYQQNRTRIRVPLEQAKEQITALLIAQEQQKKQAQLLKKLSSLKELSINLPSPVPPIAELETQGAPSKGKSDSEITLVEFSDYQCQHCRDSYQALTERLQPYLNKIRYVYINIPFNNTEISRKIAAGAFCAGQQEKLWQYHELAFTHQQPLTEESPQFFAEKLQLDLSRFEQCSSSKITTETIIVSEQQALESGVTSVPSFFINGRKLLLKDLEADLSRQLGQAITNLQKQTVSN